MFGWKSKGLSEESIITPATPGNGLAPRLIYINNAKIRVKFDGSCLKEDKVSFTRGNVINFFTVYELNIGLDELNTDSTSKYCFFLSC